MRSGHPPRDSQNSSDRKRGASPGRGLGVDRRAWGVEAEARALTRAQSQNRRSGHGPGDTHLAKPRTLLVHTHLLRSFCRCCKAEQTHPSSCRSRGDGGDLIGPQEDDPFLARIPILFTAQHIWGRRLPYIWKCESLNEAAPVPLIGCHPLRQGTRRHPPPARRRHTRPHRTRGTSGPRKSAKRTTPAHVAAGLVPSIPSAAPCGRVTA